MFSQEAYACTQPQEWALSCIKQAASSAFCFQTVMRVIILLLTVKVPNKMLLEDVAVWGAALCLEMDRSAFV